MVAVGIRSDKKELVDFAKFSGIAVFGKPDSIQEKTTKTASSLLQDKAYQAPKVVINEVNSFEQIIAKNSDLILLDKIKSGSEIMSFGSILVYKEVQGHLFSDINGDEKNHYFYAIF